MTAFIDVKGVNTFAMAHAIEDIVKEFPDLHEWAVICSFYPQTLIDVKWRLPQFATVLTHR